MFFPSSLTDIKHIANYNCTLLKKCLITVNYWLQCSGGNRGLRRNPSLRLCEGYRHKGRATAIHRREGRATAAGEHIASESVHIDSKIAAISYRIQSKV